MDSRNGLELNSSSSDPSLVIKLYDQLNSLHSPSLAASRLRLPGTVCHVSEIVHAPQPDPVTNLRTYHVPTSMSGNMEFTTEDDLEGRSNLRLVHPWIRPPLDQEFSHDPPTHEKTMQALRFVSRLLQPFGALLFVPLSRVAYRRVAADSLIMVQIRKEVPLTELMDDIQTTEVV